MHFKGSPSSANIDIAFRHMDVEAYCNSFVDICTMNDAGFLTRNNFRTNLRNRLVVADAGYYVAYSAVEGIARNAELELMNSGREFFWNRIEINFR